MSAPRDSASPNALTLFQDTAVGLGARFLFKRGEEGEGGGREIAPRATTFFHICDCIKLEVMGDSRELFRER